MAKEEVAKAKQRAGQSIRKVVTQQESAPGGIIDTVTKQLTKSAKAEQEKINSRASIEAAIGTRVVASDASSEATRSSLQAGLKATRVEEEKPPKVSAAVQVK